MAGDQSTGETEHIAPRVERIPKVEPITPKNVTKDVLEKMIGRFQLFQPSREPQIKNKENYIRTIQKDAQRINENPVTREEFLRLREEETQKTVDKDIIRLKQLVALHENAPDTWQIVFGNNSPQQALDIEKAQRIARSKKPSPKEQIPEEDVNQ